MAKRKKKQRPPETPLERLKSTPLWFWGLTCIVAGVFANFSNQFLIEATDMRGAAARGAQFGGGVASLLFIVIGVVLIVLHFLRKK